MIEQLITFETAKLAKEKGFAAGSSNVYIQYLDKSTEQLDNYYTINNVKGADLSCGGVNIYESPTQSLLQKWLREVHNLHIKIDDFIDDELGIEWDYEIVIIGTDVDEKGTYIPLIPYSIDDILRKFLNYESALESGLQEALKLIK